MNKETFARDGRSEPVAEVVAIAAATAKAQALRIEKEAFQDGRRTSIPMAPVLLAWGAVTGMAMAKSGMTIWQSLAMTLMAYAGSAQLAILPLLAVHTPLIVIFLTAMIVNLRFVIFSAALAPHFAHLPWHRRIWYGYFNGDIPMGFFPRRFPAHTVHQPAGKIAYFEALCYPSWFAWQIGSIVGILLASQIPESWNIGFAGTLMLIVVMIPMIVNRAVLAGVVVSGAVAVLAIHLPYRLGLLLAVVIGMTVAMLADRLIAKEKK